MGKLKAVSEVKRKIHYDDLKKAAADKQKDVKKEEKKDEEKKDATKDEMKDERDAPEKDGDKEDGIENEMKKETTEEKDEIKEDVEKKESEKESLEDAIKRAEEGVELTAEEKNLWFRKHSVDDMLKKDLAQSFSGFTLPTKNEGFDEIKFAWQPADACAEYLKAWIAERKLTQRVEDLQPGSWFKDQWVEWTKLLQEWRKKHSDWKHPNRRKQAEDDKKKKIER